MNYYFSKTFEEDFDTAIANVTEALKEEGFGVITEIDVKETFKKKLDVSFRKYKILGACSPRFAYQAIQAEDNIGTMLPCNIVIQEHEDRGVEVSAVDPVASMQAVQNKKVGEIANEVGKKMKSIIEKL